VQAAWKHRFRAPVVMFPTWAERVKRVVMQIATVANHLGTTPPQA